jgi:adenine-specific DNA-methyltransferase
MAKQTEATTKKKPLEQFDHKGRKGINNPPVGLVDAKILSGGAAQIVTWLLDTDYDGRSLFAGQVFFPMAEEKESWSKLAKNLKAEIDETFIEAYRGTVSLPFATGKNGRVAVKIVDDRVIESLKILEIV